MSANTEKSGLLGSKPQVGSNYVSKPSVSTCRSLYHRALNRIDSYFAISARGSSISGEILAGVTIFATVAYILLLNPQILSPTGLDANNIATGTAFLCCVPTLLIGLLCNVPLVVGPGMGLNTFFANSITSHELSYGAAVFAVFLAGCVIFLLGASGVTPFLVSHVPRFLSTAIIVGIGMYQAFIGAHSMGLIAPNAETLVTAATPTVAAALSIAGLLLMGILETMHSRVSILGPIIVIAIIAFAAGIAPLPTGLFSEAPHLVFMVRDIEWNAFATYASGTTQTFLGMMLIILFDVTGILTCLGGLMEKPCTKPVSSADIDERSVEAADERPDPLDVDVAKDIEASPPEKPHTDWTEDVLTGGRDYPPTASNLPRMKVLWGIVGAGTIFAGLLGISPVIVFLECAAGIHQGGRTGLTAVTAAALFGIAHAVIPLAAAMPLLATSPALVLIGCFMMSSVVRIDWNDISVALPSFLTIALMPFTMNVFPGIVAGALSYAIIKGCQWGGDFVYAQSVRLADCIRRRGRSSP